MQIANADRAENHAINHERDAAFHGQRTREFQNRVASTGHRVFEDFGGTLELHSGFRLLLRHIHRTDLGAVGPLQIDQIAAVINNRDDHRPLVGHGFSMRRFSDFLRRIEGERFLGGELGVRHGAGEQEGQDEISHLDRLSPQGSLCARISMRESNKKATQRCGQVTLEGLNLVND